MVKILISVVCAIACVIAPVLKPDIVRSDTLDTASLPISNSINSVLGTAPPGNVFNALASNTLWDISGGWLNMYNYYTRNSLRYTYDGVETFNVDESIDFANGSHQYAIEFQFNTSILLNNYRGFSMMFGALGDLINITSVDVGTSYDNTSTAVISYGEIDYQNYLLFFTYNGAINIRFIRVNFTANLSGVPIYNQFYKYIMYGLYNSVGGYTQGYEDGLAQGYDDGYSVGYNDATNTANNTINTNSASYLAGYNVGANSTNGLYDLFGSVVQAPVNVVLNALDVEIFGVNVSSFLISILTLAFVVTIIKIII